MSEDLPPGWTSRTIEELAGDGGLMTDGDWIESKDQDPMGGVRLIQLADVGDGEFLDRSSRFLNDATASRLRCTFLKPGDVLVARMPDPLGRACVFPGVEMPAVTAVDVCIWRPGRHAADPRWLMHIINSPPVRGELSDLASGTTRQRVSGGNLKRFSLPVPPLAEQRRIVARIEVLFARTRQARADLLRIAPLANRYRQESHRKLLDPGERGWATVAIGEIAHLLQYGSSAKTSDGASGVPVLRMGNILDGALDLTSLKFLPRDHHEFPSLLLQPGDILFNRTNSAELVGKTAVYEGEPAPCSYASYLIRLRVRGIDPTIVAAYINSPAGRAWAAASISQQVGQANINGAKLRALEVPRVPADQQQEVADALRAATRMRTRLTAEATRALALLDHLERSILTRAFRGELVPQDPADEPAAATLASAQDGAPTTPRRGRPRRAA